MGCYQSRLSHKSNNTKMLIKQENKLIEEINEILEENNTHTDLCIDEENIEILSDNELNLVNYSE